MAEKSKQKLAKSAKIDENSQTIEKLQKWTERAKKT